MRKSKLFAGACQFVVALVIAAPAAAQTTSATPQVPAATPDDSSQSSENDIIVTARKRSERLQDVPLAISAFSEKELSRYATGSVSDIAARTPQLVISTATGPGGANLNLRGVGSATTSPAVDQQVSLNIDGVQVSSSNLIALGVYDLERVEILKGPQALFFGKNSPGGVISLISADPGDTLEWRLRGSYDFNNKGKIVEGMISAPLTDKLGVRVAGAYNDQDGWFRNTRNSIAGQTFSTTTSKKSKEYFVRGTLKYGDTGDAFDARLKVAYGSQDRENGLFSNTQLISCPFGAPQFALLPGASQDCKLDRNYSEPDMGAAAAATNPVIFRDGRPYFEDRLFLSSLTANLRIGSDLTLTSVTGYLSVKEQWTANYNEGGVTLIDTASALKQTQFSQEFRLSSSFSGPLNFVLGAYYQNTKLNLGIPVTLGAFVSPTSTPLQISNERFHQDGEAYSAFGQLIFKITPQLELTGGGRYSHERKSETGRSILANAPYTFIRPVRSFDNFSPEATLSYKPISNLTLYGAYRQGFTSGGFNLVPLAFAPGVPADNGFRQSTVRGGEVGAKGTLGGGQVQFDLAVYNYDYKDLQLSAVDPTTVSLTIRNAGSSRVRGVELSTTVRPDQVRGLSLRTSVSYNQARFTSFLNAQCYQGQTFAAGCNGNAVGGVGKTQNLTGFSLERAPEWALNFGATYERQVGGGLTFSLSGDANYTGAFYAQPEHDPRSIQHETWRFNANVALRGPRDGWEIALIGKNLTNQLRSEYAFSMPFTGGGNGTAGAVRSDLVGTPSAPRTVLLQLTLRNTLFQR